MILKEEKQDLLLRNLIRNFYPAQHLIIHIIGGDNFYTTTTYLNKLNPIYLDFNVRTIEIYRNELGKLKDIIKIIVSEL